MYQITTASGRSVELDVQGGLIIFSFEASTPGKRPQTYTFQGQFFIFNGSLSGRQVGRVIYQRSDSPRALTELKPEMRDRWPDLWREIECEILPAIREFTYSVEYATELEAWSRKQRVCDIQRKEEEIARLQKELAQLRAEQP